MKFLIIKFILLLTGCFIMMPGKVNAASLNFDPKTSTVEVGKTISVDVTINVGTRQVAATDVYVLYDSSVISLQSVTGGDYFPLVKNEPAKDKVYISGVIANSGEYKTGSGKVATLVFKADKEAETKIEIFCDITNINTSKINASDINAQNIIDCSAVDDHTMTIRPAGTGGSNAVATAGPTRMPDAGVFDSTISYSILGSAMLVFGALLRFFLLR